MGWLIGSLDWPASADASHHIRQETRLARENVRCQGYRAECSILNPSSLMSVKANQGEIAVFWGVKGLSPDIFASHTPPACLGLCRDFLWLFS